MRLFIGAGAAALGLLSLASPARAATLALYDFDTSTGAPTVTASGVTLGSVYSSMPPLSWSGGNPGTGKAITENGFLAGSSPFFEFDVTVVPGNGVVLTSVTFDARRSDTGPIDWNVLFVRGPAATLLGSGSDAANVWTTHTLSLTSALPKALTGTFGMRFFASGAGSSVGTWRIDNTVLAGTVVPVAVDAGLPDGAATDGAGGGDGSATDGAVPDGADSGDAASTGDAATDAESGADAATDGGTDGALSDGAPDSAADAGPDGTAGASQTDGSGGASTGGAGGATTGGTGGFATGGSAGLGSGGTGGVSSGGTGGFATGGSGGTGGYYGTGGTSAGSGGKSGSGSVLNPPPTPPQGIDSGCGCSVPGSEAPLRGFALVLSLGVAIARLGRRRRSRSQ